MPDALDTQSIGAGGVLGALLLASINYAMARWGGSAKPATPPVPVAPAPPVPTLPTPIGPAPASPHAPAVLGLLELLAVEAIRARFAGGEIPPAMRMAAPLLRQIADQLDPPPAPK